MSDDETKAEDRVKGVYAAKTRAELEAGYDAWSDNYDQDAETVYGYCGPDITLEYFKRHVSPDTSILDAGAGTGRLGKLLYDTGYENLTGFDLSRGMLAKAEKLGVYRALHHMALGDVLDFADDAFGATACIGTLTTGHAPAEGIDELVRVTRNGGVIVATFNLGTYADDGIKDRIETLESEGRWGLMDSSGPVQLMPIGEPEVIHDVRAYRVT